MRYFTYSLLSLFLLPLMALGQTSPSPNQNYVRQINYQKALTETEVIAINSSNSALHNDKKIESIVYYDGLGRPKQSVAIRAGGNREDLVTPIAYDPLGRQPKDYLPLPVAGNHGVFQENGSSSSGVVRGLIDYYTSKFPGDSPQGLLPQLELNPYSAKRFENSPLNRVLEQAAPGMDWRLGLGESGHTIKFGQSTNTGNEVRNFYVVYSPSNEPVLKLRSGNYGNYPAQALFKDIVKDENWTASEGTIGTTLEFRNKLGQVVLKRVIGLDPAIPLWEQDRSLNHDTYYVYDDYGNLVFVLSPEGSRSIVVSNALSPNKQTILDALCYQYRYDHRNRLAWKKIPGKGAERILYDILDRPVLTQDSEMAKSGQWLFTKYDALGRVVYTGIYSPPAGRNVESGLTDPVPLATLSEVRTATASPLESGGRSFYYSNTAYPTENLEVLTVSYYDDYVDYKVGNGSSLLPPTMVMGAETTRHSHVSTTTQGLSTVGWVKTLGTGTPGLWTTSVAAYDSRGRIVRTDTYGDYLQVRDISNSQRDPITGRVEEVQGIHIKTGQPTVTVHDYFAYDHMGRLLSHNQQIGNEPAQLIEENTYDGLGQLVLKKVGGETTVDGYTDIQLIDVTFDGTVIHGSDQFGWPSRLKTKGKIVGDGGISFRVEGINKHTRVGLLKPANGNAGNIYLDYGFYLIHENNQYKVRIVNNGSDQSTSRTYLPGDIFKVERAGNQIKYYHNSTSFATVNYAGNGEALTGKVTFSGGGGGLSMLRLYGPRIDKVLQHVAYRYNIRGWLTDINNVEGGIRPLIEPLFNFRINYNKVEGNATVAPLYNGNIAQTLWRTSNEDKDIRGYGYSYDRLNRITGADSYRGTKLGAMSGTFEHDVQGIGYDLNGNIKTLSRWGADEGTVPAFGQWDALSYSYNGNQLMKVEDNSESSFHKNFGFKDGINTGDDYLYDDNGNMTQDLNKGVYSILYNHLNLPTKIHFDSTRLNYIEYVYDATGNKLSKAVQEQINDALKLQKTFYAGNYIYARGMSGETKLQFFSHAEGYVEPVSGEQKVKGFDKGIGAPGTTTYSSYKYVFQYKDHLGNVRLSYSDSDLNGAIDPLTEILSEKNYYPFGLLQKGYNNIVSPNVNSTAEKFQYNGKEINEELGLDWYDFQARNYDPALGRWMNIDPLAEKMRRHSPYNYAFDNPVYFIDPDGMMPYGSNCCGDKPSPVERIKQGFQTFFSGLSEATEQFFNDSGYSTPSTTGFKPTKNKSSDERLATYAGAADKVNTGTKDIAKGSVQGAADAATVAAETVSEASSYTTILTGGASAPVTVPLQKGADVVAAGSKTVSASIDYSDGDIEAGNEKMADAGMDIVVGKAGSRVSKAATKHVSDKVDKQVQENVIETVIGWFKDASKYVIF